MQVWPRLVTGVGQHVRLLVHGLTDILPGGLTEPQAVNLRHLLPAGILQTHHLCGLLVLSAGSFLALLGGPTNTAYQLRGSSGGIASYILLLLVRVACSD